MITYPLVHLDQQDVQLRLHLLKDYKPLFIFIME